MSEKITSMMAGNVWKVLVKKGDEVEEGDDIVILESMKMEIPVSSDVSGRVESVDIEEGQFVNEGDVIVTIRMN